jgi:uncharacterized protein (AIM24 family)
MTTNNNAYRRSELRDFKLKREIKYKPSYSKLVVNLEKGEVITEETGAMTYMDPTTGNDDR